MRTVLRSCALALALALVGLAVAPAAAAIEAPAVVTILEGTAQVIRGANRLALAEGVRIAAGDLVETASASFLQVEFDDGTTIDVGPGARLQFEHPARRRAERPGLYLLSGWLKIATRPGAAGFGLAWPAADALDLSGTLLIEVAPGRAALFVENGGARLVDHRARS